MNWFYLSLGAAVIFSAMTIILKFIFEKGFSPLMAMTYLFSIAAVIYWLFSGYTSQIAIPSSDVLYLLIAASVLSAAGNLLLYEGVKDAPNAGYAEAVGSLRIVLITVLSVMLFNLKPELISIVGVLLILSGAILLNFSTG